MSQKLSVKNQGRLSLTSIVSFLFFFNIISIVYIQSSAFTLFQYAVLAIVIVYCTKYVIDVFRNDWKTMFSIIAVVGGIVISSYVNHVDNYNMRGTVYYILLIVAVFIFLAALGIKGKLGHFLRAGRVFLFFVLIVNDILMLVAPNKFYNVDGLEIGTFILGNKFNVAYAHLMLFFFSLLLEKDLKIRRKKAFIYAVILSAVCIYVDCNTVMLSVWLFILFYFFSPSIKKVLSKPIVFFVGFFISGFLLIGFSDILSFSPIQSFIVNVLHRDADLTGRLNVYPYVLELFERSKWFGYGYGNQIVKDESIWYANAQNGFWGFVINYGIITMFFLIVLLWIVISKNKFAIHNNKYPDGIWICNVILYVFLFVGIVEISFGIQFLFYIALLNAMNYQIKHIRHT